MKTKVVCFVLALAMASVAQAQPDHMIWDGAGGDMDWTNPGNWYKFGEETTRRVPGPNDVAYPDGQTGPVVAGPATGNVGNLWVGQFTPGEPMDAGCVMNGVNITVTGEFVGRPNRGAVGMGHADGNYTLEINDSTLNVGGGPGSNDIVVGSHWQTGGTWGSDTSTSVMTIDNSTINASGHNTLIGGLAYGSMTLQNGTNYTSTGVTWVGFYGHGELTVDASTMNVGVFSVSDQNNPDGAPTNLCHADVINGGVITAIDDVYIGTRDNGVLNVSGGGIFEIQDDVGTNYNDDIMLGFDVDGLGAIGTVNVDDGSIFRTSRTKNVSELILGSATGEGIINIYGGHVYTRSQPVFDNGVINLLDYDGVMIIRAAATTKEDIEAWITAGNIRGIGGDTNLANFEIEQVPGSTFDPAYTTSVRTVRYVPEASYYYWQGGPGNWADTNWDDGSAPPLVGPAAAAAMVIDAAGDNSVVTVAADFISSGDGPAASVDVGETHTALLIVNNGVTLEVTGEVAVGNAGTLNVDGTLTAHALNTAGTLNVDGTLTADVLNTAGTTTLAPSSASTIGTLTVTNGSTTMAAPAITTLNVSGGSLIASAGLAVENMSVTGGSSTFPGGAVQSLTVGGGSLTASAGLAVDDMTLTGGSSTLAGGTVQTLNVVGGSLSASASLAVDNIMFTGGVVDTTSQVEVQDGGSLATSDATFGIAGATFGVSGSAPLDIGLRLGGGTLTVSGSGVEGEDLSVPDTDYLVTANSTLRLVVVPEPFPELPPNAILGNVVLAGDPDPQLLVSYDPFSQPSNASFGSVNGTGGIAWDGGAGQFSVRNGGTVSPGSGGSGQLSIGGNLTMEPGAVYQWGVDTAGVDALAINGRLDLAPGGSWTLKLVHGEAPIGPVEEVEPIPVASYNELAGDSLGDYIIDTSQAENWVFTGGVPSLDLVPSVEPAGSIVLLWLEEVLALQWKTDADGLYSDGVNWFNQAVPDDVDAEANFLDDITFTDDRQVTVDKPLRVGTINLRNGDWSYTLAKSADAGDVITLQTSGGDPQINVVLGNHTITAPLAFGAATVDTQDGASLTLTQNGIVTGDLTKEGNGSMTIGNGVFLLGGLNHNGGVLEVGPGVLALPGGGTVTLADGATLRTSGEINRRVLGVPGDTGLGVPGSTLEVTDTTEIGLLNETDGYAYQGSLEVGPHMLGLEDADEAPLYGAHIEGGTVSSFNGIRLLPINVADGLNSRLYGYGTVNGNVVAGIEGNPTPAVVVADPGQTIELTGVAQTGNSTFIGNVSITGTERLGFSPAVGMKLGGAPIGPDAVVEVYGTAGADFESEIPDALAPPVADPVSGYGQFYVAGGESLVSGKITLSTGGSDYVGRGGDTFDLIVTGQAWLMDFTQFPPQNVLLPEGSVNIDPGFTVDTSGIPLASPGLFWQEFRSDQGLTLKIVPEPGTLVLLITGGLGLLLLVWRRRRS